MPSVAPKTRSVLIELLTGEQIIVEEIPSAAKITFGPLQPGSKEYGPSRDTAVRIYTTAGNQLAVFRNAASFRDLSLTVKVRASKVEEESTSESGPKGSRKSGSRVVQHEWVEA